MATRRGAPGARGEGARSGLVTVGAIGCSGCAASRAGSRAGAALFGPDIRRGFQGWGQGVGFLLSDRLAAGVERGPAMRSSGLAQAAPRPDRREGHLLLLGPGIATSCVAVGPFSVSSAGVRGAPRGGPLMM